MYKILSGFFWSDGLCENLYYNKELGYLSFNNYRIDCDRFSDGFAFENVDIPLRMNSDVKAIGFALNNNLSKFIFYSDMSYTIVRIDTGNIIYKGIYSISIDTISVPSDRDYFSYADYVRYHNYSDNEIENLDSSQFKVLMKHRPEYHYLRKDITILDLPNIVKYCPRVVEKIKPYDYQISNLAKINPEIGIYTDIDKLIIMCLLERPSIVFSIRNLKYEHIKAIEDKYPKNWEVFLNLLRTEFDLSEDECAQRAYEKEIL